MASEASAGQDPSCQACLELAGLGISVLVPLGDLPRDPGKVASPCWASVVSSVKILIVSRPHGVAVRIRCNLCTAR